MGKHPTDIINNNLRIFQVLQGTDALHIIVF